MTFRVEKELPKARASVRDEPVDWEAAKRALIENEGDWVLVADNVHATTAEQLRRGRYAQFPETELDSFEFVARKPEGSNYAPRRTDIWCRYTSAKKGKR